MPEEKEKNQLKGIMDKLEQGVKDFFIVINMLSI